MDIEDARPNSRLAMISVAQRQLRHLWRRRVRSWGFLQSAQFFARSTLCLRFSS